MKGSIHEVELSSKFPLRPIKKDISYGVMGLSQISMNHGVKELLLNNMLQMDLRRVMDPWEQTARCKWGRQHGKRILQLPVGERKEPHGSHENGHVPLRVAMCYFATITNWTVTIEYEGCLPLWLQVDTKISCIFRSTSHMNHGRWRCHRRRLATKGAADYSQWTSLAAWWVCSYCHLSCVSMSEWVLTSLRVHWGQAHNVQSCHGHALNITLCCSQVRKVHTHTHRQPCPLEKQRAITLTEASLPNSIHWCMKRLMLSQQH